MDLVKNVDALTTCSLYIIPVLQNHEEVKGRRPLPASLILAKHLTLLTEWHSGIKLNIDLA